MALNSQKYRDALAHLGQKRAVFTDPPEAFHAWLTEKQLPGDLVEFLLGTALAAAVPFPNGSGGMWTPRDVMDLNDQESAILSAGLFAVGSAVNGDFIVIDLRDERRQAGFVGHDELAESSSGDVRAIFVPVADSIDEMLVGMSGALWECFRSDAGEQNSYPCDYCDALTWRKDR